MYISLHTSKSSVNVSSAKKDAAYIWFGDVSFDGMHAYSPQPFQHNTFPSLLSKMEPKEWNLFTVVVLQTPISFRFFTISPLKK